MGFPAQDNIKAVQVFVTYTAKVCKTQPYLESAHQKQLAKYLQIRYNRVGEAIAGNS